MREKNKNKDKGLENKVRWGGGERTLWTRLRGACRSPSQHCCPHRRQKTSNLARGPAAAGTVTISMSQTEHSGIDNEICEKKVWPLVKLSFVTAHPTWQRPTCGGRIRSIPVMRPTPRLNIELPNKINRPSQMHSSQQMCEAGWWSFSSCHRIE